MYYDGWTDTVQINYGHPKTREEMCKVIKKRTKTCEEMCKGLWAKWPHSSLCDVYIYILYIYIYICRCSAKWRPWRMECAVTWRCCCAKVICYTHTHTQTHTHTHTSCDSVRCDMAMT